MTSFFSLSNISFVRVKETSQGDHFFYASKTYVIKKCHEYVLLSEFSFEISEYFEKSKFEFSIFYCIRNGIKKNNIWHKLRAFASATKHIRPVLYGDCEVHVQCTCINS